MRRLYNIFLVVATIVTVVACQKEIILGDAEVNDISCGLIISIANEVKISDSSDDTRSTSSADDVQTPEIHNVWIAQFEDNKLVGKPIYISDPTEIMKEYKELSLVSTSAIAGKLVVIANAGEESLKDILVVGALYSELKDTGVPITKISDCDTPIMSYVLSGKKIIKGDKIDCKLTRNIAQISATIVNSTTNLTIDSMQLCNVPDIEHYIIDDEQKSIYPTKGSFFNYKSITTDLDKLHTFQMPVNMRGEVNECSNEAQKPYYASSTATYLLVNATYGSGESTQKVEYRFYLGKDLVNDYNILRNTKYNYTINIKDVGDPDVDSRVTFIGDGNEFDYTTQRPSNCYILNPSEKKNTYFIPVVERINEFWGNCGYANEPDNMINDGDDWSVEMLWGDCEDNNQLTLTEDELAPSGRKSLKVELPANAKEGNIVVAVKKGDVILWSWHFWITKYNPDSEMIYKNKYVRTVTGGEVHCYDGSLWKSGAIYDGKYIMDRNIGALSNRQTGDYGSGTLYYQFGRKDPFPGKSGVLSNGGNLFGSQSNDKMFYEDKSSGATFAESIMNPTTFFAISTKSSANGNPIYANGNNWCKEKNSMFGDHLWNDFKAKATDNSAKSIFDPSPLGWRVPKQATWQDFNSNNFRVDGTDSWVIYNNDIYYPTNGGISSDAKLMAPASGYVWSSSPEPVKNYSGKLFLFRDNGEIITNFSYEKAYGRPVRAVQE